MMKNLLLIIILLFSGSVYSQSKIDTIKNNTIEIKIDSTVRYVWIGNQLGVKYKTEITNQNGVLKVNVNQLNKTYLRGNKQFVFIGGTHFVILEDINKNKISSYAIHIP